MTQASGFPSVSKANARILILGSMPGQPSLTADQYYANPRNAFWRIMAAIHEFDPAAPYRSKLAALKKNRIALWDVVKSCYRKGSLDSAIRSDSVSVNGFAAFFEAHSSIETVFFNGGKAEQLWRRHVAPTISNDPKNLELTLKTLPSTSPAHAAMSYETKLKIWQEALSD